MNRNLTIRERLKDLHVAPRTEFGGTGGTNWFVKICTGQL